MTDRRAVLRLTSRAGAARAVPTLVRAFWDYSETCHLLPREDARRRVLPRYLGANVRDAARHGGLEAVMIDEAMVGVAAWLPPDAYPIQLMRQVAEAWHLAPVTPWGIGALREARRGGHANRAQHRTVGPHYWLRVLGVDPPRQGDGIGTQLVRSMLQRADAEGCGAFLFTASAQNAAWYESLGFVTVASYRPTPTWPVAWAMWRDAEVVSRSTPPSP